MPRLEVIEDEAPEGYAGREGGSTASSTTTAPDTPLTTTPSLSSGASFSSPSPEAVALYRILSDPLNINNEEIAYDRNASVPSFPREQTLLDLLIQSTGVDDLRQLRQIREVRLRIISSVISLSRLEMYTPHIRVLRLDGSSLTSLREIGTSLQSLKILHVSRCGLMSLDGTFGLTGLTELNAADNQITNVGPCIVMENIRVINLDRNPLVSISNVSLLSLCSNLTKLSMKGSPVSRQSDYKMTIRNFIPQLRKLDGVSIDESDDSVSYKSIDNISKNESISESSSAEVSSMTDPSNGENDKISSSSPVSSSAPHDIILCIETLAKQTKRPSTATGLPSSSSTFIKNCHIRRPCTSMSRRNNDDSDSESDTRAAEDAQPSWLTSGGIVCGNIARALSRARPARRPKRPSSTRPIDAWVIGPPEEGSMCDETTAEGECVEEIYLENESPSSSPSGDHRVVLESAKRLLEQPFPERPIETAPTVVDLELGVTGSTRTNATTSTSSQWDSSSQSALRVSQRWRKAFRLYRKSRDISVEQQSSSIDEISEDDLIVAGANNT